MQLRIVERTISKPKASKYAPLLAAMAASLKADGADNRLRAVEETAGWSRAKLRRWTCGLRCYYRTHRAPGYKLSLRRCTANGLTFRWVKAR